MKLGKYFLNKIAALLCAVLFINSSVNAYGAQPAAILADIENAVDGQLPENSSNSIEEAREQGVGLKVNTEAKDSKNAASGSKNNNDDDSAVLLSENDEDTAEAKGTVFNVYSNMQQEEFVADDITALIGKCELLDDGTAIYHDAIRSSEDPSNFTMVRVPRRIIVTQYDGVDDEGVPYTEERIYDYTDGYFLDDEGYATLTLGGERRKDPVSGNDVYIGKAYDVTNLAPDTFENCPDAIRIEIPRTITNDITYDYFTNCRRTSVIEVYTSTYDPETHRYESGNDKEENTFGVLVDTKPKDSAASSMIIWCPPRYNSDKYVYYIGSTAKPGVIIGPHAFENCINLKNISPKVSLTQQVLEIGEAAFKGCDLLEKANVFSPILRSIGDEAFMGCISLSEISPVATGGTVLGDRVFANTSISKIEIPVGYNSMRGETFVSMNALAEFTLLEDRNGDLNSYFTCLDNVLYRLNVPGSDEDDGIELVRFPEQLTPTAEDIDPARTVRESGAFLVPYQVTGFDEHCFYKCANLSTVYFPSTIMDLQPGRFVGCISLANLYFYSGLPDFSVDEDDYAATDMFECSRTNLLTIYAGDDTPIYKYAQANASAPLNVKRAALYEDNKYEYRIVNGEAYLTGLKSGYSARFTDLIVPNYYHNNGTRYLVTGVDSGALADRNLTSVRFLHDMKNVAQDAFYIIYDEDDIYNENNINSTSLTDIYVEYGNFNLISVDGVLYKQSWDSYENKYYISEMLYYPAGNTAKEYTTVKGLNSLPRYAFWGATSLKKVNIHDDIQYIGRIGETNGTDVPSAFAGCNSLVMVNVISDEENPTNPNFIEYYSHQGVLYKWDHNSGANGEPVTLLFYPKGQRSMKEDGLTPVSYEVVDGCREIKDFKDCRFITKIIIPHSVTTIDEYAFEGCSALNEVTFLTTGSGSGITTIGDGAFMRTDLYNLTLPATIKTIGEKAFYYCVNLEDVYINGNVLMSIGERAFMYDRSLKTVTITDALPNQVGGNAQIGSYAFARCQELKSVVLTSMGSVSLGEQSFSNNKNLENLDFSGSSIVEIGTNCFANCAGLKEVNLKDCNYLLELSEKAFYNCDSLSYVHLPYVMTKIGDSAFKDCDELSIVNFSNLVHLEEIGERAFAGTSLVGVVLPENVTKLGNAVFENCRLLSAVYVHDEIVIHNEYGQYGDPAIGAYNNPFADFGKELYVYGKESSDVHDFIQWMDDNGFKAPTFIVRNDMPKAIVYMETPELTVYDMGDNAPILTAYVSSEDELLDYSVNFICSNPSLVKIQNVYSDGTGLNTCEVVGLKNGITKIYAINPQTGDYAYCVVRVEKARVETEQDDILLNTKGAHVTEKINATSYPTRKIYYKTSDRKVVLVNDKGVIKGKKPGNTTIVVYAGKDEHYVEKEVNVTVFRPTIALDKKKLTLNEKGDVSLLSAGVGVTHSGAYEDVKWSTSNKNVATVEGDNEGCIITAVRSGKCIIYAECNGITAKCRVTVRPVQVNLSEQSVTLYSGGLTPETHKLKAVTAGINKSIHWESSDDSVVVVDNKGTITVQGPGNAYVSATCNGVSAKCMVHVKESTVKLYAAKGDTIHEKDAIVINSKGDNTYELMAKVVGRNETVKWASTSKNVFIVDSNGLVTGIGGGTAELTATANGVTAVCEVTVIDTSTELDYANATLYLDESTGKVITITATIEGADTAKALTWDVEDKEIVSISNASTKATYNPTANGGSGMATITAKKAGKTRVSVKANGVTAYCTVTVK